jgi:hypothetical protein
VSRVDTRVEPEEISGLQDEIITLLTTEHNYNNRTLCAGLRAPQRARVPLSIASQEVRENEVLVERVARCQPYDGRPCRAYCREVHCVVVLLVKHDE